MSEHQQSEALRGGMVSPAENPSAGSQEQDPNSNPQHADPSSLPAGLAVFVKTPELSPVKTRLAADIGEVAARRVYEHMLGKTAAMMRQVRAAGVATCWAVGEQDGVRHPRWREFPAVFTGEGDLGERLCHVYHLMQERYGRAVLTGSDCPQLSAETVLTAARGQADTVTVGPSQDGGFYLFAADFPISARVWNSVRYSRNDTLQQLLTNFDPRQVQTLPVLADVDDLKSLQYAGMKAEDFAADIPSCS